MIQDQRRASDAVFDDSSVLSGIQVLPSARATDHMGSVLRIFEMNPDLTIVPILNSQDEPVGAIAERDFKRFMYLPYGLDLLRNRSCPVKLSSLSRPCPVLELGVELGAFVEAVADDVQDGVLVTRDGKYIGFLAANMLLKVSNRYRIAQAEDRNPLSRLAGNRQIERFIERVLLARDAVRALCVFDFDHFKPFNDTYGFRVGDRAIHLFSELMRSRLGERHWFLGHVGGDDFFGGCTGLPRVRVEAQVKSLIDKFAYDAESFYEPEHRELGYISGCHRDGTPAKFGLLSCSAAILVLEPGYNAGSLEDFGKRITALKKAAKSAPNRLYVASLAPAGSHTLAA